MKLAQTPWKPIRTAVATADSGPLDASNSDWENRSLTRGCAITPGTQAVLLSFIGDHATDPATKTATVKVSVYRYGGPAQVVQSYDLVVGDQLVVKKPYEADANATAKWVDEIVADDADPAAYYVSSANSPEIFGVLTNNVAGVAVKTFGAAWITVEITALAAGLILDVLMAEVDGL